jgi:hypothetical protein
MAATILNSSRAVEMSVYVVRAFVKLRELVASNRDLEKKLARLERSLLALDLKAQQQFKDVYAAIRAAWILAEHRSSLFCRAAVWTGCASSDLDHLPAGHPASMAALQEIATCPPAILSPDSKLQPRGCDVLQWG